MLLKYKVRNCTVPRNLEERDFFRAGLVDKSVQFAVDDLIHDKKQQVGGTMLLCARCEATSVKIID